MPLHLPITSPLAVSEEAIQKLRFLFPEELLTAAFDLVDKESGTVNHPPSPLCFQALCIPPHVRWLMAGNALMMELSNQVHDLMGSDSVRSPWLDNTVQCFPKACLFSITTSILRLSNVCPLSFVRGYGSTTHGMLYFLIVLRNHVLSCGIPTVQAPPGHPTSDPTKALR